MGKESEQVNAWTFLNVQWLVMMNSSRINGKDIKNTCQTDHLIMLKKYFKNFVWKDYWLGNFVNYKLSNKIFQNNKILSLFTKKGFDLLEFCETFFDRLGTA